MKEDIEQAVLEMIKKSGVELGVGELESIIDASFNTASEHISNRYPAFLSKKGRHIRRWWCGTQRRLKCLVLFKSV
ncbi:hypothetical protein M4B96_23290 [Klebsiella pneumoniae]|nr:hypothetical protein [Klebsiella pneumoniae]